MNEQPAAAALTASMERMLAVHLAASAGLVTRDQVRSARRTYLTEIGYSASDIERIEGAA